jgi:ABC-type branched-subunit amino acid transport system ATPase component
MYPTLTGLLSPTPYGFQSVIDVLIVALIGGLFAPGGALLGAVIFQAVNQSVSSASPGVSQIVYGLLLLAILWLLPRGVIGALDSIQHTVRIQCRHWRSSGDDQGALEVPVAVHRMNGSGSPEMAPSLQTSVEAGSSVRFEATGMTVHFGAFCAVDDVEITILGGQVTGIIGANGAGKSTLLDLLTGFRKSEGGRVELIGDNGEAIALEGRSAGARTDRGIIRTFQQAQLVPELTVEDNIRVAQEVAVRSRPSLRGALPEISSVLKLASIEQYRKAQPSTLPYGIAKLVDVARLVAVRPLVAFLDEPAAGLGEGELPALRAMIEQLKTSGAGVAVIEHNLDFIGQVVDELYVIDFGRVLISGAPTEVLASNEVLEAYAIQASVGGAHERA